jgi:thiamine biosynthesis lipoprotein
MRPYAIAIIATTLLSISCNEKQSYTRITGFAQGTTYAITYEGSDMLKPEVEALLARFDSSLSIYNRASIISKVNNNEEVELDSFFIRCFELAQKVTAQTNGAFDMSAAPLFQAWGFGSQRQTAAPTARQVDSLKTFCGMDKFFIENNRVVKTDPRARLNANAIAKGYAVDVVSQFLESKGKRSYLVEIGGEIFCRGVNQKGASWTVGIDRPTDGNFTPGNDLQAMVRLSGRGLATSGNYRNFYLHEGKKEAHTIHPKTGYPACHNLLGATVMANSGGEADAFATAFMVMGLDSAKSLLQRRPELDAYLVYAAENGEFKSCATDGFEEQLKIMN